MTEQRGMFSYTGLNEDQVDKLRDELQHLHGHLRPRQRGGPDDDNIEYVCKAIADVVGGKK